MSRPHVKSFIERFKKDYDVYIFNDSQILNDPIESWPRVDFLISFYHTNLPLTKVFLYTQTFKINCINDLFHQFALFDRRIIYKILNAIGVNTPDHFFVNRDQINLNKEFKEYLEKKFNISLKLELNEIKEFETFIEVDNKKLYKPFVEKPANAEDHNIYIYLKNGTVRKLFRKQENKSSAICFKTQNIRREGSFIYEKFYEADEQKDIKVYAIGKETAYAESRKAPTIDGVVERDFKGKEKREIVKLKEDEYEFAHKISMSFNQFICGFDILRNNGISFVFDVNGWSFVKNNRGYYDMCFEVLKREIEKKNKTQESIKFSKIIKVYRHGDRTPKQKIKMKIQKSERILEREIQVNENFENIIEILKRTDEVKFKNIINTLENKKKEKGTKLQIKYLKDYIEIICKWGGILTHTGISQSKELGESLRYSLIKKNYELLSNVKIFSSSESRVSESAESFASALSFEKLTVLKNKQLLDDTFHANGLLEAGRKDLNISFNKFKTKEDEDFYLNTIKNLKIDENIFDDLNLRWIKIKEKVIEDNLILYNRVSEINDNIKFDLIHNNEKIKSIFNNEKIVEFFLLIRKYYRFLIENEYGKDKDEKIKTSAALSGELIKKIVFDIEEDDEGINIYFTKESRMYTIFNILNILFNCKNHVKEFNYGSFIGFYIYKEEDAKRIKILHNRGIDCQEIVDGCLDLRHRVPFKEDQELFDILLKDFISIINGIF
ncbi:inositol hexakisphosphate and diphosphoinositol-pentakisphosphate kinase [Gurleya vavrai]